MLQKLKIINYAIIDELAINFSDKLNIITGETGAGKSILMGALDLVLGKRADTHILKDVNKKCVVEANFILKNITPLTYFFEANDLDPENEILIRREIAVNGKSRSFVNDTPVNLTQLKELSAQLVDLHRQFDTQDIGTETFQREVLDALADNFVQLTQLKAVFNQYSKIKNTLTDLKLQQANANREADYNTFLLEEFEQINLQPNEIEQLDTELKLLTNAEDVKLQLTSIYTALMYSDEATVPFLKVLTQKLSGIKEYHPSIAELQARLLSAQLEIKDIANELETIDETIRYDAERIHWVNERIAASYSLQKKHGVISTEQLLAIQQGLQQKQVAVLSLSTDIEQLEAESLLLQAQAQALATTINKNRTAQILPFTQKVNQLLSQIGMPNAAIKIQLTPASLTQYGHDDISFLFDANKSNKFEPLHKVASGGELSRLMLAVKSLVAYKLQLPVLIFDEIDTGISGEAAKQVGIIMQQLSMSHQLIAITHQPQIAAKAAAHYYVYKHIVNDAIHTSVRLLNDDERIVTIAQMLSGEKPTVAALANAKEMMN